MADTDDIFECLVLTKRQRRILEKARYIKGCNRLSEDEQFIVEFLDVTEDIIREYRDLYYMVEESEAMFKELTHGG